MATAALFVPLRIVTPQAFLGGSFYSIDILPPFWQIVALFLALSLGVVAWIFKTGCRLKA